MCIVEPIQQHGSYWPCVTVSWQLSLPPTRILETMNGQKSTQSKAILFQFCPLQLMTHSFTTSTPPISGWSKILASQYCNSRRRLSRKAGRKRARGFLAGSGGIEGTRCRWTSQNKRERTTRDDHTPEDFSEGHHRVRQKTCTVWERGWLSSACVLVGNTWWSENRTGLFSGDNTVVY